MGKRISWEDSWNKIQERYQAGEYGTPAHLEAQAAAEIKTAIETVRSSKRMFWATLVLVIFTAALCVITGLYTHISSKALEGSEKLVGALDKLTEAVENVPVTEYKLQQRKKLQEGRRKNSSIQQRATTGRN